MSLDTNWIEEKLRALRKEKGLSVHKVGRQLGVSGNYVSEIERGKSSLRSYYCRVS